MNLPPTNQGGMPDDSSAIRSELSSDVQRVGHSAANRLHSELDSRKGTAASQVKSVSSAMDRAAGELDEGVPDWLKSAFQQGAAQVRRFADTLEQKDSRQILNDVRGLARDNPGTFLAGCAALGFATARVFKAGEPASSGGSTPRHEYAPSQSEEPVFRSWGSETARSPAPGGDYS